MLGVLSGYLLPAGLMPGGLARDQCEIIQHGVDTRQLPPYPGNVAPTNTDWEYDCLR